VEKNVHLSTDHVDILDVSIEGCTDERLSHFLTPLLGNMNNDLCVYGWELCQLGSTACESKCSGRIEITYLDMSVDTFEMDETIVIREECRNLNSRVCTHC
jgi:hypothetical protein